MARGGDGEEERETERARGWLRVAENVGQNDTLGNPPGPSLSFATNDRVGAAMPHGTIDHSAGLIISN